jgi:hypothetical protein
MKLPTTTLRRLCAGAAFGALVTTSLLMTSPAQADPSITVTKADIRPDETTYAGWHEGSGNPDSYDVTNQGLLLTGRSQVINGYANTTTTLDVKNAVLSSTLPATTYDITSGDVYFQVPIFFTSDTVNVPEFTTLRPAVAGDVGENDIALTDDWISSKTIDDDIQGGISYPLEDILSAINDYKTLAFGVFADPGTTGTVSDITWAGNTYLFRPGTPAAVTVTNADVDGFEADNYARWHEGYEDAQSRHQVTAKGLELSASNAARAQIIKGYANNTSVLDQQNFNLANHLTESSFTATEGVVSFQVPLFYKDGGGVTRFATLRSATVQDGSVDLGDLWQTSRAIGTVPANVNTPVGDIIAALGDDYKVIGFGVQAIADAVVSDITWDGTKYTFSDGPVVTDTKTVYEKDIAAEENAETYSQWHQGYADAAAGAAQVSNNGLELDGKSQVMDGYENNTRVLDTKNILLADAVQGAAYTVESGTAFFQIPLFFKDGDAALPTFTTLRPAVGAGTGDHTISVRDQWVSSKAIGSLEANTPYPLSTIIDSFEDYKILGFGFLTEIGAHATVSDVTWNGTKHSFVNRAPAAAAVKANVQAGSVVVVAVPARDADGNSLTYTATAVHGTVTFGAGTLRFTAAHNYLGSAAFGYTVADGRGGTASGKATFTIVRADSHVQITLSPTAPTSRSVVTANVLVKSTAYVKGGRVDFYDGSKKVGTGLLQANGTVRIVLTSKLAKGTHTLRARFLGTKYASPRSRSLVVTVRR